MTAAKPKLKPCGEQCPDMDVACDLPAEHEGEHQAHRSTFVARWGGAK